jgi:hypothetical protein
MRVFSTKRDAYASFARAARCAQIESDLSRGWGAIDGSSTETAHLDALAKREFDAAHDNEKSSWPASLGAPGE